MRRVVLLYENRSIYLKNLCAGKVLNLMRVHRLYFLQCNNHEIRPGKHIGVCISVANNRLFVGSIPKSKTKEQIVEEFSKVTGNAF